MTSNELKDFYDAIDFAANAAALYVYFKSLKLKFPSFAVKSALNDTTEVEGIIDHLFYRKQVMWEQPQYENLDCCVNSLKDLKDKCDQRSDMFFKKRNGEDKNYFFAVLLRTWGNYCDEAYKEIFKIDMKNSSLDKVLLDFRKQAYPIIATFIFALPDHSISKQNAYTKLELGVKNSKLTIKKILPTWSIEP